MLDIKGKWVLVTGSSRGIGREIALYMADRGANIIIHGKDIEGLREVSDKIKALGVELIAEVADFSDTSQARKMAERILEKTNVDILFNNAGVQINRQEPYYLVDEQGFKDTYAINVISGMIMVEKFLPHMLEQGFGRIINTSTSMADLPCMGEYAATKGALDKLTFDYHARLKDTGVTMNVIDPGWIATDMGGSEAPYTVDTVVPGMVVTVFAGDGVNGRKLFAQDYRGMGIEEALGML